MLRCLVTVLLVTLSLGGTWGCVAGREAHAAAGPSRLTEPAARVRHTDAEWRSLLSGAQYAVLRRAATERPFTSPLVDEHRDGTFACAACGTPLFSSAAKFDSGTGWPSFSMPVEMTNISERSDDALGLGRTEVVCAACDGHLGHVFPDGPDPTGLRYCINGVALVFTPNEGGAAGARP